MLLKIKTFILLLCLLLPVGARAQWLKANELIYLEMLQNYSQAVPLLQKGGLKSVSHPYGQKAWRGIGMQLNFQMINYNRYIMRCYVYGEQEIHSLIDDFTQLGYIYPRREDNYYRMVHINDNMPDIILSLWEKKRLAFFFTPLSTGEYDDQSEVEAEADAYPELRLDPSERTDFPKFNTYEGRYLMEGKLDKTYYFSFILNIFDNTITGHYFSNPQMNKPAGVVKGELSGDHMNIKVLTNGKITRTFTGRIKNNTYSGSFVSGYNGAKRTFSATMQDMGF